MAATKISALPADDAVSGSEQIPVNDAGTNKRVTPAQIAAYVNSLLGTAASEDVGAFATAVQGALAGSAVQPGDAVSDLVETTTAKIMTSSERAKLTAVAIEATANATDAQLRDRATHTGTQSATTITGLATVATTGAYADLSGTPTLGSAAAEEASAFDVVGTAVSEAGSAVSGHEGTYNHSNIATAIQPGDDVVTLGSGGAENGQLPTADGTGGVTWQDAPATNGGVKTFAALTDTPADYSGAAGKLVKVNPTGDALIFGDPSGSAVAWGDITGSITDQTDLAAVAATGSYSDLSGAPTLGTASAQDSSAFDAAGAASSAVSSHASSTGVHSIAGIAGLQTALDGKSATTHHHDSDYLGISATAISAAKLATARTVTLTGDVTGSVSFDGSENVSFTTAVGNDSHTHTFTNITSKPTTLGGYGITDAASLSHNHTLDALSNTAITSNSNGEILKWNGSAWVNSTLAEAGISATSHNHTGTYEPANTTLSSIASLSGSGAITRQSNGTATVETVEQIPLTTAQISAALARANSALISNTSGAGSGATAVTNLVLISATDYSALGTPEPGTTYLVHED